MLFLEMIFSDVDYMLTCNRCKPYCQDSGHLLYILLSGSLSKDLLHSQRGKCRRDALSEGCQILGYISYSSHKDLVHINPLKINYYIKNIKILISL